MNYLAVRQETQVDRGLPAALVVQVYGVAAFSFHSQLYAALFSLHRCALTFQLAEAVEPDCPVRVGGFDIYMVF